MAQANLGSMYFRGEGVPQNYVEAYKWEILAGAQEWANKDFLEEIRRQMTSDQLAEAQKLASQWKAIGGGEKKIEKPEESAPTVGGGGNLLR